MIYKFSSSGVEFTSVSFAPQCNIGIEIACVAKW